MTLSLLNYHYLTGEIKATSAKTPKLAIIEAMEELMTAMKSGGSKVIEFQEVDKRGGKPIKSKAQTPKTWAALAKYAVVKKQATEMKMVKGKKSRDIAFTILMRVPYKVYIESKFMNASIDLQDNNIFFDYNNLQCPRSDDQLVVMYAYANMGSEYSQKALQDTLKLAWKATVDKKSESATKKAVLRGIDLNIRVILEYPKHDGYQKFVKGQKPKYQATNKRQLAIEYNADNWDHILDYAKEWKDLIRPLLGPHAYICTVPEEEVKDTWTIKKFQVNCNQHLVMN